MNCHKKLAFRRGGFVRLTLADTHSEPGAKESRSCPLCDGGGGVGAGGDKKRGKAQEQILTA